MGESLESFRVMSGVRQGANASPPLYILLAEVLSIQIRNNNKIKGITLGEKEFKLAQFADDLNLFLQFEYETLMELENTLHEFEVTTGLQVNYDKTC